jgi:hypothetical protein
MRLQIRHGRMTTSPGMTITLWVLVIVAIAFASIRGQKKGFEAATTAMQQEGSSPRLGRVLREHQPAT